MRESTLLSIRSTLILLVAAIVAVGAGALARASGASWPGAGLVAGGAFGGAIGLLNQIIDAD